MLRFRIQSTPNPQARKYIIEPNLKSSGKVSYQKADECAHVPLADALISIDGVSQIHFFENVVTVTQDGRMDWAFIDNAVQGVIASFIDEHDPDFPDENPDKADHRLKVPLTPELQKIDDILEKTIRPGLQMDGGDVEPLDLDGDILTVRYMGACGGCPSAMYGTLDAMRSILRSEYSEKIEVIAI